MRSLVLFVTLGVSWPATAADLRFPAFISDHMVVQRECRAPLWGTCKPGALVEVSTSWSDEVVTARADASGRFDVVVETGKAGGPHTVTFRCEGDEVRFEDVLLGEVWICSGQSNMEMPVDNIRPGYTGVDDYERELGEARYANLRLFDVVNSIAPAPKRDCEGEWQACTPDSVAKFSAAGYFFGRDLLRELDVPIGLIGANWGGTRAEAWTSREGLAGFGHVADELEWIGRLADDPDRSAAEAAQKRRAFFDELTTRDALAACREREFDATAWSTMTLPAEWRGSSLEDFDGAAWFVRDVELPATLAGRDLDLSLGPIDDIDTTWWNGVRVGAHEFGAWQTPRRYVVPGASVSAGRNRLAVRVVDTGGLGGLVGPAELLYVQPAGSESGRQSLAGPWRFHAGAAMRDIGALPSVPTLHANSASALFNGMIAPLVPYRIRGAIWYQGESNIGRAEEYRRLFPNMIGDWRRHFGHGDFPFYFVQIAPFNYRGDRGGAAILRDSQRRSLATANTGMAVTMDIGDPADIHPTNKWEVGRRLALWALRDTYGHEEVVCSGPLYRAMRVEGGVVRLLFDHVGGGLASRDGKPLTHFEVAGADSRFVPAEAEIVGDAVLVRADSVAEPKSVRYAYGAADEPNLVNLDGLPAASFITD